jgi:hypothetical protein
MKFRCGKPVDRANLIADAYASFGGGTTGPYSGDRAKIVLAVKSDADKAAFRCARSAEKQADER